MKLRVNAAGQTEAYDREPSQGGHAPADAAPAETGDPLRWLAGTQLAALPVHAGELVSWGLAKHYAPSGRALMTRRARLIVMSSEIAAEELPAGTNEVAHLAAWVFLQVILVVFRSLPERPGRGDLSHDLSRPEAGCLDVRDAAGSGQPLFFTGAAPRGAVLYSPRSGQR